MDVKGLLNLLKRGYVNFFSTTNNDIKVVLFATTGSSEAFVINKGTLYVPAEAIGDLELTGDITVDNTMDKIQKRISDFNLVSEFTDFVKKYITKTGMIGTASATPTAIDKFKRGFTVERFLADGPMHCNKDYKERLIKLGFSVDTSVVLLTTRTKRDYSHQFTESNPRATINKTEFEKQSALLTKIGASLDNIHAEAKLAFEMVEKGIYGNILLTGKTGTGKSIIALVYANTMRSVLLEMSVNKGTQVEDLVGCFQPNEKANSGVRYKVAELTSKIKAGEINADEYLRGVDTIITTGEDQGNWIFQPGKLLIAYSEGYVAKVDEINFGDPAILAAINPFTDGTLGVTICGKYFEKHPEFVFIGTCNPGYTGTIEMNLSLVNRLVVINVPAVTKEMYIERVNKTAIRCGHALPKAFLAELFTLQATWEKYGNGTLYGGDGNCAFSIRNGERFVEGILSRPVTLNEFEKLIFMNFINDFNVNSDNETKTEAYKTDKTVLGSIKTLYDLYDLKELEKLENDLTDKDIEDIFGSDIEESVTDADTVTDSLDDVADELSKAFDSTK